MFRGVSRRLALLNAAVVALVIALVGVAIVVALERSLNSEIDQSLYDRVDQVRSLNIGAQSTPTVSSSSSSQQDESSEEGRSSEAEVLESGDTILFVVNAQGQVEYNPRGLLMPGVPVQAGVKKALNGQRDVRTVDLKSAGSMRVLTVPLRANGQIVGAVQGLRSLQEHDTELRIVRLISLLGVGIGALLAIPAGFYLSSRAMRPIRFAFDRQRSFVADASHELRTPLSLIRLNAELIRDDAVGEDTASEASGIVDEVDRMDRMVDDLLVLARADSDQLGLVLEPTDIRSHVGGVVETMRPLATSRDVDLTFGGDECVVPLDVDRITQVIRILIDNAIKHTPPGGRVHVTTHCATHEVDVSVHDTGVGIPPEAHERVFDRFYRVDKARSRAAGGTGLGLPIAKAIVEAHGGQIWLKSAVGQGTTVTFRLKRG